MEEKLQLTHLKIFSLKKLCKMKIVFYDLVFDPF